MTENAVPLVTLNNGVEIPQLGFGVFKVDPDKTNRIVRDALDVGYRHLDTAKIYHNEEGVGHAVHESGIARDELFITTKLWNDDQTNAPEAFQKSLARLRQDYVDLYLIHWPTPERDTYIEAWRALEGILESGKAKAIGVSNFTVDHLDRLISETGIVPAVNQVELHVDFQQAELRSYAAEKGIAIEAWGPLGQGKINESEELASIAAAHGKSVPQTILRWHLDVGNIVIPKSNNKERMAENFDILDFSLSASEIATIATLDQGEQGRNGSNPLEVN
ncbi:aldo/keto reductase [Herbiconiux sp.]|uniref:aldo/keto reductase n=1 Tax=Herbiconiux sp. TaxID=1871186 RepID=UPI0025C33388|nr:aldo/keto reductase [Herbiconiux sp.]